MNVNFKYTSPEANDPVVFEQIYAEKPGGGLVANQTFKVKEGTAVGLSSGKFAPIKAYRLLKEVKTTDTSIEIAKGSGVAVDDIIAHGDTGVKCTAVDTTTNDDKDVVTVTLGVAISAGTVLYQSKVESAAADGETPAVLAEPLLTPLFVTGQAIEPNEGDKLVKLVNGANLRKETANISAEVAALLPTINLV